MLKHLLLFIVVFYTSVNFAQQEEAWVFLADKENVAESLSNPISILSQAAIDRKNTHNIPIDFKDVPVNEAYISQLKLQTGITVKAKSKWLNAIHVSGTQTDITALNTLEFVSSIEFANRSFNTTNTRVATTTNKFELENTQVDFTYGQTQNQVEMIAVDQLHENDFTGEGIIIAVIDAGFPNVDTMGAFQRLRDNGDLLGGYDFVDRTVNVYESTASNHGTQVLSTMGGYVENSYVGTAPDASYYVFRTEDALSENPVEESYWVEAAERADSLGVHIINSSLGYKQYDNSNYTYSNEDLNGEIAFISRGAQLANDKGILVVNSAGNSGASGVGAPADAAGVFTIGSVTATGSYSGFSSQGSINQPTPKPDIVAQGSLSAVITDDNTIVSNSGTSFSSPIIAGAIASLLQAFPNRSIEDIKNDIRESASQFENHDYLLGYGIPNFWSIYQNALSVETFNVFEAKIYPNPVQTTFTVQLANNATNTQLEIYSILGKQLLKKQLTDVSQTIDVSSIASGIYVIKISKGKESQTFKFIKS
ncbi:S8 family serine peptidase [Lacinutrix undariae]